MDIDIYQTCPCQSGKKIKFCCGKAIVGDLHRIVELNKSRQLVAALEHIQRTFARSGDRECLYPLKTHVLMHLNQFEEAEAVNAELLTQNPHSPIGLQQRAMILAQQKRTAEAVDALQDALDCLPNANLPVSLCSAFRVVGMLMVLEGYVVGGRAHLMMANRLNEDPALGNIMLRTWRDHTIPLPLRYEYGITEDAVASDCAWRDAWVTACRHAMQGRFRCALQRLQDLAKRHPDSIEVTRGIACMQLKLGREAESVESWNQYLRIADLDFETVAEYRALVYSLDSSRACQSLDIVRLRYDVPNQEAFQEKTASHPRIRTYAARPESGSDDTAPPLVAGQFLDRDKATSIDDGGALPETLPLGIARFFLHGKRTDRSAFVDVFCIRDTNYKRAIETLESALEDVIGKRTDESVSDTMDELAVLLNDDWDFPRNATRNQRVAYLSRARNRALQERMPQMSVPALSGRTVAEAAEGSEEDRTWIAGLLLFVEDAAFTAELSDGDFAALRESLGLPARTRLAENPPLRQLPTPFMFQRIDFSQLDDEELLVAMALTFSNSNVGAIRDVLKEILSRPELDNEVPFDQLYTHLASITVDDEKALEYFQEARRYCTAENGRSAGLCLVAELDFRMRRDLAEGCQELLSRIESRYLDDENVKMNLGMVLQKHGLLDAPPTSGGQEPVAATTAPQESAIWTPESEGGGSSDGPGLWLPE